MDKQSKILTLDNLYQFFVEQNKIVNFNSKDAGKPIIVTTNGFFETNEDNVPGMLRLKLKVCHTELNRNGSFISKENMENAMPSLKYRPILAYIHTLPNGEEDFYAHNMEIIEDENGEEKINYLEKQVGCFTADEPYLEYDEGMDKTYVIAYAVIPEEYTSAADIIRRKNGTKVSCELVINELSYNAKEKYLDLTDFYFGATSLLGCDENGNEIGEGMLGARADISDFCHKEPTYTYQEKLINTLERLSVVLESFNNTNAQEEGGKIEMDNTENTIVVEEEAKTSEEITEENAEEITDEETFTSEDTEAVETEVDESETEITGQETYGKKRKKACSIDKHGNVTVSYEISHEETRSALYVILREVEDSDNEWYFITNVFDSYFVYENFDGNKCYRQDYVVENDNISFSGERIELFKMLLTESEKVAIDKLRSDYAALETKYNELVQFKANVDAAELKSKKDAIFARDEYAALVDDGEFKALVADAEKYSVAEVESKVKEIFADYVIKTGEFSIKSDNTKKPKVLGFNLKNNDKEPKSPYGNLFSK